MKALLKEAQEEVTRVRTKVLFMNVFLLVLLSGDVVGLMLGRLIRGLGLLAKLGPG